MIIIDITSTNFTHSFVINQDYHQDLLEGTQ